MLWLWWILVLALFVFVVWAFIDMINKRMPKMQKALWIILFFIASVLTSIVWLFVRRARR